MLRDKAFNIVKNPKYDGYQRRLASMVYNLFDKNVSGSGIKNDSMSNKELTEELKEKQLLENFKREQYARLL